MASSARDQDSKASEGAGSTQYDNQYSYALQEYLRAEPTITDRISGAKRGDKVKNYTKHHESRAKDTVKKFDDAWNNASK
ncbi:hypothetical protein GGR52DRAFT_515077 [Hypoxylon sp. FL1284]|nr:hypothetical protein GGR52DRAFT_515077 [Hypoxylon sp. FL1284]